MGKIRKWNSFLCEQLCEHFCALQAEPTLDNLCVIEKIEKVINGLSEIEMNGAIRAYAEEKLGYDRDTGRFDKDDWKDDDEWDEYDLGIYDAMDRRRRDRRGRFVSDAYMPPYYPDWERGPYADHRSDRNDSDGEMYRIRQENGKPIRERMYAIGNKETMKPKKLTEHDGEEWMKHLENDDGTMGPHFSKEEVKQMAQKHGIKFDEFSEHDLYLAVNMMYSDYCDSIEQFTKNPDAFLKLAVDFLDDEDFDGIPAEKLSLYYHDVVKHKEK